MDTFWDFVEDSLLVIIVWTSFCLVQIVLSQRSFLERKNQCHADATMNPIMIPIWKDLPIELEVDPSVPDEAMGSLLSAAHDWEKVMGQNVFTIKRVTGHSFWPHRASTIFWVLNPKQLKITEEATTTISWSQHQLFKANIYINAARFQFSYGGVSEAGKVDFESLLVHELGHVLGLAHKPGGVMNWALDLAILRVNVDSESTKNIMCLYADRMGPSIFDKAVTQTFVSTGISLR